MQNRSFGMFGHMRKSWESTLKKLLWRVDLLADILLPALQFPAATNRVKICRLVQREMHWFCTIPYWVKVLVRSFLTNILNFLQFCMSIKDGHQQLYHAELRIKPHLLPLLKSLPD